MKKIVLVFVSLLMIFCLASCNRDEPSNIVNNNVSSVEVSEPFVSVSVTKDANGNILQHILFNKHTKVTYIYDYEWVYDYGAYVCSGSWLTVIDAEGNEVPDEPQVSITGCACAGGSGDAYNDVYPGYRLPGCTCSGSVTNNNKPQTGTTENTDNSNKSIKPCTIYNKNNIIVTIISGEYNELFEVWCYDVKIENNSNTDIIISTNDESFNNMMLDVMFGFFEEIPAGKTALTSLNFWNMEDIGISELVGQLTMTIDITDSEWRDLYSETINLEFK